MEEVVEGEVLLDRFNTPNDNNGDGLWYVSTPKPLVDVAMAKDKACDWAGGWEHSAEISPS